MAGSAQVGFDLSVSRAPERAGPLGQRARMGPGGHRSGGHWKLGLPLIVMFGLAAVLLVPVIWTF